MRCEEEGAKDGTVRIPSFKGQLEKKHLRGKVREYSQS